MITIIYIIELNRRNLLWHLAKETQLTDHVIEIRNLIQVSKLALQVDLQFGWEDVYQGSARQFPHGLALLVTSGQVAEHFVRELVDLVDNLQILNIIN